MSQDQTRLVSLAKKRWPKVVAIAIVIVAGLLVTLPHAIRMGLERWLVNNGAQSAEIKKIHLNLFRGTVRVTGLKITLDDNVVLGDDDIQVNIALSSLFRKEGRLQSGRLSGLILEIELYPDGALRIGSITTPPSPGSPEAEKTEKKPWLFGARHLELENCLVRFTMPGLSTKVYVEKAVLENFSTGSAGPTAHLELQGSIDDAPVTLVLDRVGVRPDIATGGLIKIDGYRLDNLRELLQDVLDPFTGSVSLDGKIQFSLNPQGEIATKYDGTITLDQAAIGNAGFGVDSPVVSYSGAIQYEMDKNSDMVVDVNGLLQGEEINLGVPAAGMDMAEKHLKIDGRTQVVIADDLTVTTDAHLSSAGMDIGIPPMNIAHSGLDWQGDITYKLAGNPGIQEIRSDGKLVFSKAAYGQESEESTLHTATEQLSWQGRVNLDISAKDGTAILTDGELRSDWYQLAIPDQLDLQNDSILTDGKTDITIGQGIAVTHEARRLDVNGLSVTAAGTTSSGSLSWQGQVGYQMTDTGSEIQLGGTLTGTKLESLLAEQNIRIGQQNISVNTDRVSLMLGERIRLGGTASLEAGHLQVSRGDSPLLRLEKTTVTSLAGTDDWGLKVDEVNLDNLNLPASEAQPMTVTVPGITLTNVASSDFTGVTADLLQIRQTTVRDTAGESLQAEAGLVKAEKIAWSTENGLVVDQIILDSIKGNFTRLPSQDNEDKAPEPEPEEEKTETTPPAVRINKIAVTGNSSFTFADKAISVPFETTFKLEKGEVTDMDFTRPEAPFSYTLKGKFDGHAPLDISGTSSPFAEKFLVDSTIRLRNYSLEKLSPYIIDAIGTKFVNGQLNVTSKLNITDDILDLDNDLVLQQIKSKTVSEELLAKLNNELPVPLDMALTMLRDKKGDIRLSIPVSGPLAHISVDPTDILVTALSKAIAVSVTPYLAYTFLGPAGALVYAGVVAGEMIIDTSLPRLEFESQATELTDAHREVLDSIGQGMEKNADTDYTICSKVLLWELAGDMERNMENQKKILQDEEMRKKLLEIAETRARNVKKYLLNNYQLDEDKLLVCSPSINFEPNGKPFVGFRK